MTWKNVTKLIAAFGVLAALAIASGADFVDGFSLSLDSATTTTSTHHR